MGFINKSDEEQILSDGMKEAREREQERSLVALGEYLGWQGYK